jgi:hypothetical protein
MLACEAMSGILSFGNVLWAVTMLLVMGLVALVLWHRSFKAYPLFFAYIAAVLMQNLVFVLSYRLWGFSSTVTFRVTWSAQGFVTLARALAVAEICHRILARFRGIWGLAWRLLLAAAAFISLYAWAVSRGSWPFAILNLDRGLELAMSTVIVLLFVFSKYYEVRVEPAARTLAIGFLLYSSFRVVNDTILEGWLHRYTTQWNLLGTLSFLASMLLWTWAFRRKQPETAFETEVVSEHLYRTLVPEINARLRELNEQLGHFWHVEGKRT